MAEEVELWFLDFLIKNSEISFTKYSRKKNR